MEFGKLKISPSVIIAFMACIFIYIAFGQLLDLIRTMVA